MQRFNRCTSRQLDYVLDRIEQAKQLPRSKLRSKLFLMWLRRLRRLERKIPVS